LIYFVNFIRGLQIISINKNQTIGPDVFSRWNGPTPECFGPYHSLTTRMSAILKNA
ncbi:hypothetical protein Csa_021553, partial [Cucumis sativus]